MPEATQIIQIHGMILRSGRFNGDGLRTIEIICKGLYFLLWQHLAGKKGLWGVPLHVYVHTTNAVIGLGDFARNLRGIALLHNILQ